MRFSSAVLSAALLLAVPACRHDSLRDRIGQLQSVDPAERRFAADSLRDHNGPPPTAVPYLFQAIEREQDEGAYCAMLITLGASGAPQAKPLIEANLRSPSAEVRRWAGTAMEYWRARNGIHASHGVRIVILPPKHRKPPPPPPPPPLASSEPRPTPLASQPPPEPEPPPPQIDGCDQFAKACAADPFDNARCKRDLASWPEPAVEAWAACLNASNDPCQKTYDECVAKTSPPR